MNKMEIKETLRREQNILDRIDNVRRLIEMETTLLTVEGAEKFKRYHMTDREGKRCGSDINDLLHELRDTIQLQLLSITAMCYGSNPDVGEPDAMLEWTVSRNVCTEDVFRDTWDKCLNWNA